MSGRKACPEHVLGEGGGEVGLDDHLSSPEGLRAQYW
jgi:hypothetical protein